MKTKEILEDAYHLLDDKKHWTQGCFARDRLGRSVYTSSNSATCWCAIGALEKVALEKSEIGDYVGGSLEKAEKALTKAIVELYKKRAVPRVNDGKDGYRKIRAAYRRAIRSCEDE